jgi:hypothetical protein
MMDIKSHGDWQRYTPHRLPEGVPPNAMFSRRIGDGVDWYDYVNSGDNFAADSIKLTLREGGIVGAAVTDPTMLFPGDGALLEISGAHVDDPQRAFGMKVYDPVAKTFSDPPPMNFPNPLDEILKRLEALEKKKGPD